MNIPTFLEVEASILGFSNRVQREFNIMDNKLPLIFMSDMSIGRTIEQEVELIIQDVRTENACFIHAFRLKVFVCA